MALLADHRPHYADPQLWLRLGPRISEHYEQRAADLIVTAVPSYDVYMRRVGYLEALRWVLAEARDLNKGDDE